MDGPDPALKVSGEHTESPDFDELISPASLVRGDRTRDDFFDAVLGLDSPSTVAEVADRAGHGVDAAREYLEWFERMGIVTQVTESPVTYRRNQEYLNWRRVQQLRNQYTPAELTEFLQTEMERDKAYAEEFDVPEPDAVTLTVYASETDSSVAAVRAAVAAWKTTRRRIDLLERALATDGESPERPTVA